MSAPLARPLTIAAALAIALSACGGDKKKADEPKDDPDKPAPYEPPRRVIHLALEYVTIDPDADPVQSRVSLVVTDENGASRRELVGDFDGGCSDVSAQNLNAPMTPILSLDCWSGDIGTALRFVHRPPELVVLRAEVVEGTTEPAFDIHKNVQLPPGVPVTTDLMRAAANKK